MNEKTEHPDATYKGDPPDQPSNTGSGTMSKGLVFWIVWLICLLAFLGVSFSVVGPQYGHFVGGGVVDLILTGLLGWGVFGPPIK
jgi:hypothetical protein